MVYRDMGKDKFTRGNLAISSFSKGVI